jgi:hypothetical protein
MKLGTIYLITNKINGKQYVGQTARDMWTRFEEHCKPTNQSYLGRAIQKYGYLNFDLRELERVPIEELDAREIYWIDYYNTFKEGYNQTLGGGNFQESLRLFVVENGYVIESIEEFGRMAQEKVGWSSRSLVKKIREVLCTGESFLGYHFETRLTNTPLTDYDKVSDWIQTLQIRFCGKHIYCFELKKEFNTIAECGRYLINNDLSITTSQTPLQSLVTSIGKQLHGSIEHINSTIGPLTFAFLPGQTKNTGAESPFAPSKVYCSQLDKEFDSQTEAAEYMVKNKIWDGIKLKTAKLRISDIVNGNFPSYKGYTFERR